MTKNVGFIGYRIFLNDDSIIEHTYKRPISLDSMLRRVANFVRQNKMFGDVEGFALLNIDPCEELYLWRELTSHRAEWKFSTGREEKE